MKKRVLSGIQPSGSVHIGNYLGAIKNWVASQEERENFFCVVNLHALTLPHDPATLRESTRELAAILFAAGIDPDKSSLFVQSQVHEHAELAWIMNCVAHIGQMSKMVQFKDKSDKQRGEASVGLFTYPALMAADILLYQTDLVPVGDDQKQHVELCRDLAQRFNHNFGETFKIPDVSIPKIAARVMSLQEPTKKMSKSDEGENHVINVLDEPAAILKKCKKATTDSGSDIRFDPKRPGVFNLLSMYQACSGQTSEQIEAHFEGKGYGHLKIELAELITESLAPLQQRYKEIRSDETMLDKMLLQGQQQAQAVASETLSKVKQAIGIL